MTAHPAATVVVTAVLMWLMTENDDVKMDVSIEWFDPVSQGYSWTIKVRFPTLDVESLIGHEAFTPYLRIDSLPTTKVIDPTKH